MGKGYKGEDESRSRGHRHQSTDGLKGLTVSKFISKNTLEVLDASTEKGWSKSLSSEAGVRRWERGLKGAEGIFAGNGV